MFLDPATLRTLRNENFKQIEDIIDARKLLGQYNIYKPNYHVRCVYSTSSPSPSNDKTVKFDESSLVHPESSYTGILRYTDSEITVFRVKCDGCLFSKQRPINDKWDMLDDIAIPGDGTHLADSPSLVNLATLVTKNVHQCEGDDEYLVPLSSWDPSIKNEDFKMDMSKCCSDSRISEKYSLRVTSTDPDLANRVDDSGSNNSKTEIRSEDYVMPYRRDGWTGRVSKCLKKQNWNK